MRFKLPNGRLISRNIEKTRIDWEGKSLSLVQYNVKQFLKPYWRFCICYEEMPIPQTRLHVDLINFTKKIAIEPGGEFHFSYSKWAHKGSRGNFLKSIRNDTYKREFLELNGFKVIEIHEKEVPLLTKDWFENKFEIKL